MNNTVIFPKEFYSTMLFHKRERIGVNEQGQFFFLPKEPKLERVKRFVCFQQDPMVEDVIKRLKLFNNEVADQSLSAKQLNNETEFLKEKDIHVLLTNLIELQGKFNKIGKLNPFSNFLLKIINFVRSIFKQTPLKLYRFLENENQSVSFPIPNADQLKALLLQNFSKSATKSCQFTSDDPTTNQEIEKLELGFNDEWVLREFPLSNTSITYRLMIRFNQNRFELVLNNKQGSTTLPKGKTYALYCEIKTDETEPMKKNIQFNGTLEVEIPILEEIILDKDYQIYIDNNLIKKLKISQK